MLTTLQVWLAADASRGFVARCCGYAPTKAKWKQDLAAFAKLDEVGQKAAQDAHLENGADEYRAFRHHHQLLFTPPGVQNGMESAGVDALHLLYLNTSSSRSSSTLSIKTFKSPRRSW